MATKQPSKPDAMASVKRVLAAHLLPEGKVLAIAILAAGKTEMTPQEAGEAAQMTRGEVEYGATALRAAKLLDKDGSDGSIRLSAKLTKGE